MKAAFLLFVDACWTLIYLMKKRVLNMLVVGFFLE